MSSDEILFDAEERMEKALSVFQGELRGLRTGRATPALVVQLKVEYYGSPTPLKTLAQINCPEPQYPPRCQQAIRSGREGQGDERGRARSGQGESARSAQDLRRQDRRPGGQEIERDHGTIAACGFALARRSCERYAASDIGRNS